MQRLNLNLNLKLLSKSPKNLSTPPFPFSPSKNGIITQQNNFSNPISAKHFLTNSTLSKCQHKGFLGTHYGSVKALFSRRSFHSLDSRKSGSQKLTSDGRGGIWALILSNAAIFILWQVADRSFMIRNFTITVDNLKDGQFYSLITHAYSHMDICHLCRNMVGLYYFGTSIGRKFGPKYILNIYLAGAVVSAVFELVYSAKISSIEGSGAQVLGASGAVNAIMLLQFFLFGTFPRNNYHSIMGILIIGHDLYRRSQGDPHISGASYLGGATVAAVARALVRRGV